VSFVHRRIKNPTTIPGENASILCGSNVLSPVCPNAENGNSEKGMTIYRRGNKVWASESKGFSSLLKSPADIIMKIRGAVSSRNFIGIIPDAARVEKIKTAAPAASPVTI